MAYNQDGAVSFLRVHGCRTQTLPHCVLDRCYKGSGLVDVEPMRRVGDHLIASMRKDLRRCSERCTTTGHVPRAACTTSQRIWWQHGLATADKTVVGRHPRTIYTITPSGEHALRAWLATPSVGPSLESEAIVKVFCAVQGTKAELLSTIETIRAQGLTMRRHGTQVAQEYRDGRNAFPERMHTSALMFDFLWQYSGALIQWAERATQAVTAWDGLAPEGKAAWAMQVFSQPLDLAGEDVLGAES
jgi:hypothetical protein